MLSFRHTWNFIRKHCAAIGKDDFRHCRNCRNTFYRCRHKSISQLLKRGTYHANVTASRYTSDPFRHWNPASDHSADSGTDRNRSQLSGLYGGLQGRRTKRILSPAERVLSGKSTPDSAAGRQFACGRRRSFSTADAKLYLGISKADAVPAVSGKLQQYQQCPGHFCRKRHPVYCYELSEQHSVGTAGVVAL